MWDLHPHNGSEGVNSVQTSYKVRASGNKDMQDALRAQDDQVERDFEQGDGSFSLRLTASPGWEKKISYLLVDTEG